MPIFPKLRRLAAKFVTLRIAIVVALVKLVALPLAAIDALVAHDAAVRLGFFTAPSTLTGDARWVIWTFLIASAVHLALVVIAWWQLMYGRSALRRIVGGGILYALSVMALALFAAFVGATGALPKFGSTSQNERLTWGDLELGAASLLWVLFILFSPGKKERWFTLARTDTPSRASTP